MMTALPKRKTTILTDPFGYSFSCRRSIEFEREAVLNHRVGNLGRFNPGGSFEGLLLGMGDAPIPAEYHERQALATRLVVFDSQGRHFASSFKLYVERACRNRIENKIKSQLMSYYSNLARFLKSIRLVATRRTA
jgi:hypothetical protein